MDMKNLLDKVNDGPATRHELERKKAVQPPPRYQAV